MTKISRADLIEKIAVRYADILELTTIRKGFLQVALDEYTTGGYTDSGLLNIAREIGAIDDDTELE